MGVESLSWWINDFGWTMGYLGFVCWLYFFHSPLRERARLEKSDWYAQILKIIQVWCMVHITFFHLLKRYLDHAIAISKSKAAVQLNDGEQLSGGGGAITEPSTVFFPLLAIFVSFFSLFHREKRRWMLGITYGATVTMLLMNSLILSFGLTLHLGTCTFQPLFPHVPILSPMICPSYGGERPLATIIHLSILGAAFVFGDYTYKRRYQFNEPRSLLWSSSYDLRLKVDKDGKELKQPLEPHGEPMVEWYSAFAARVGLNFAFGLAIHLVTVDFRAIEAAISPKLFIFGKGNSSGQDEGQPQRNQQGRKGGKRKSSSGKQQDTPAATSLKTSPVKQSPAPSESEAASSVSTPATAELGGKKGKKAKAKLLTPLLPVAAASSPALSQGTVVAASQVTPSGGMTPNGGGEDDDLWFDFTADIGDGFNSTYEIARLLAQPMLKVKTSAETMFSLKRLTEAARNRWNTVRKGMMWRGKKNNGSSTKKDGGKHQRVPSNTSFTSHDGLGSGTDNDLSPQEEKELAERKAFVDLPRGQFLVLGGDLAYPTPTAEEWQSRFFSVYNQALPRSHTVKHHERLHCNKYTVGGTAYASGEKKKNENSSRIPAGVHLFPREPATTILEEESSTRETSRDASAAASPNTAESNSASSSAASPSILNAPAQFAPKAMWGPSRALKEGLEAAYIREPDHPELQHQAYHEHHREKKQQQQEGSGKKKSKKHHQHSSSISGSTSPLPEQQQEQQQSEQDYEVLSAPMMFAIPGNHDWFDGCQTFRSFILSKSWCGGWFMPQKSSYFALSLPNDWFIFGLDNALSEDIDPEQLVYFLKLTEKNLTPNSSVIIVTHEPSWLNDHINIADGEPHSSQRTQKLVDILGNRLRVRIAGDIHNYSRYSPLRRSDKVQAPVTLASLFGFDDRGNAAIKESQALTTPAGLPVNANGNFAFPETPAGHGNSAFPDPSSSSPPPPYGPESAGNLENEANYPQLIVSGGGGAFLHGSGVSTRNLTYFGQRFQRRAWYPLGAKTLSLFRRVFGFRLVNWKFDLFGGALYSMMIYSLLPMNPKIQAQAENAQVADIADFFRETLHTAFQLIYVMFNETYFSACVGLFAVAAMISIIHSTVPMWKRLPSGIAFGFLHIVCATFLVSFLHHAVAQMSKHGMLLSTKTEWKSFLQIELYDLYKLLVEVLSNLNVELASYLGGYHIFQPMLNFASWAESRNVITAPISFWIRSLDVVETFEHLRLRVTADPLPDIFMGDFNDQATRFEVIMYYAHFIWFYWLFATPAIACLLGFFFWYCVTVLRCGFDPAYSAFRIEDYKHFLRFRMSKKDGSLEVFVIGVDHVPKQWEADPKHLKEKEKYNKLAEQEGENIPPHHLWDRPSIWRPKQQRKLQKELPWMYHGPRIVERFTLQPTPRQDQVVSPAADVAFPTTAEQVAHSAGASTYLTDDSEVVASAGGAGTAGDASPVRRNGSSPTSAAPPRSAFDSSMNQLTGVNPKVTVMKRF